MKIEGIRDSMGQLCSVPRKIASVLLEFYSGLFSSPDTCQPKMTLDSIQRFVIDDMNYQLSSEFLECED